MSGNDPQLKGAVLKWLKRMNNPYNAHYKEHFSYQPDTNHNNVSIHMVFNQGVTKHLQYQYSRNYARYSVYGTELYPIFPQGKELQRSRKANRLIN